MYRQIRLACLIGCAIGATTGCGGDGNLGERTGEAAAETVPDTACETATLNGSVYNGTYTSGLSYTNSSPDGSYNIGASCSNQWLNAYNAVPIGDNEYGALAFTAPTSQTVCEGYHTEVAAYYWNGSTWTYTATTHTGVWSGGACNTRAIISNSSNHTQVRVGARVYWHTIFGDINQRVTNYLNYDIGG